MIPFEPCYCGADDCKRCHPYGTEIPQDEPDEQDIEDRNEQRQRRAERLAKYDTP